MQKIGRKTWNRKPSVEREHSFRNGEGCTLGNNSRVVSRLNQCRIVQDWEVQPTSRRLLASMRVHVLMEDEQCTRWCYRNSMIAALEGFTALRCKTAKCKKHLMFGFNTNVFPLVRLAIKNTSQPSLLSCLDGCRFNVNLGFNVSPRYLPHLTVLYRFTSKLWRSQFLLVNATTNFFKWGNLGKQ